ncbi:hypothetical protein GGR57DRAFT_448770 [Xylariaceae sp. FL1272]|nr:hypothetical protein GGR57DRAFT_448770 [Xylariaceae sp. FL1272]
MPSANNKLTEVSATVSAFVPNITCEKANIAMRHTINPWTKALALDSPSCSAGHFASTVTVATCYEDCPMYNETFSLMRVNCSEAAGNTAYSSNAMHLDRHTPYDMRLALMAMNSTNTGVRSFGSNSTAPANISWVVTPTRTAAVICKFDYGVQNITSTLNLTTGSFQIDVPGRAPPPSQPLNLTGIQLGELLFTILGAQTGDWKVWDLITTLPHGNSLPGTDLLFNAGLLSNLTTSVFSGLSAQLIRQQWMSPANASIKGAGVCHETRLHIQPVTLWGMVALFVPMSFLPLVIAVLNTGPCIVPLNTSAIAALAVILRNSPSLRCLLASASCRQAVEIKKRLAGYTFKSDHDYQRRFQLVATPKASLYSTNPADARPTEDGPNRYFESAKSKADRRKWKPIAAGYPFLCLMFFLPLLAIGVLEALYQISRRNHGLAQASYTTLPFIQYATSFVVLAIVTTFNAADFSIQSCSPFHALASRRCGTGRAMFDNFLDKLPPVALYHAAKRRLYFGSALSNVATIIGSALAIVSSGLWVVQSITLTSTDINTTLSTTWDLRWNNSANDDGGAAALLSSIDLNETASPDGVWNSLVFPDISATNFSGVEKGSSIHDNINKNVTYMLPALRPTLLCDAVPTENIRLSLINSTDVWNNPLAANYYIGINTVIDLPAGCPGGPHGDRGYIWLNDSLTTTSTEPAWRAELYDVHLGPWNQSRQDFHDVGDSPVGYSNPYTTFGSINQPDNPNGCPSIVAILARVGPEDLAADNVTVLLCSQMIQEVQTRVSLRSNTTGRIGQQSLLLPPSPNESTAVYLTNGTDDIASFNYRVQPHFDANFTFSGLGDGATVKFFNHIVAGSDPTSFEAMTGPSNVETLESAVNRLYQRYMVQVMNSPIFRRTIQAQDTTTTNTTNMQQSSIINGTASAVTRRLIIDPTSKLILQIILATMAILEALALSQIRLRGLLPRSPCSIASVMALIAGSDLRPWEFPPEERIGGKTFSHEELRKAFCEQPFRMGWWQQNDVNSLASDNHARDIDGQPEQEKAGLRFGIEVGNPVHLGFELEEKKRK